MQSHSRAVKFVFWLNELKVGDEKYGPRSIFGDFNTE